MKKDYFKKIAKGLEVLFELSNKIGKFQVDAAKASAVSDIQKAPATFESAKSVASYDAAKVAAAFDIQKGTPAYESAKAIVAYDIYNTQFNSSNIASSLEFIGYLISFIDGDINRKNTMKDVTEAILSYSKVYSEMKSHPSKQP